MGNGSIKAPRTEENTRSVSIRTDSPSLDTEILRMRINCLELELVQRDQALAAQEVQLQHLQRELNAKVSQIDKLQDAIGYNKGSSSGRACHCRLSVIDEGAGRFRKVAVEDHQRLKAKEGVSAEPTSENFCGGLRPSHISMLKSIRKDSGIKKLMNDAITNNDFLKRLEPQHTREMVDCMYEKVYTKGQLVIHEGESGNYLYVLADGSLQVIQSGKLLSELRPGTAFGELAILYNCKRTATVKAVTESHVWALDRQTFQAIMMRTAQARHEEYFRFLRSVSLLQELPEEKLAKIVDCLEVDYFQKGDYIIREGEEGNTFFIIAKGQVIVTQSTEGFAEPQQIKTLGVGRYFGEKALISEDLRSANIICNEDDTQCLVVDRDNFNQMVGTYEELQSYLKEYVEELSRSDQRRNALPRSPHIDSAEAQELRRLKEKLVPLPHHQPFQHLEVIATLGMGGFGRVELVKLKDEDATFALKCIKKKHVVDTRQQEHIYSEKNILQQTNSPFIIRFFRTFRDNKHVYMLLEVCLGGELWTVLRDIPPFAGSDPIRIYTMVLHGIEKVDFPKRIGKRPDDLIRKLCKLNPVERVGNKKNGIIDIKKHKWFQGFNWEGLRRRKLPSPLKRELNGPLDHSYFDIFPPDTEMTPEETSGWDKDF
ncbi:cGMP-dependent protein kinase 2 isoform X2 [Syngnathus scovelli]|uniref:cGMP-dependent protein kinase 2 isoform X2 n=1 Tax=Syngnathus scovelli TaxID=161590 RepID=UPI0021105DED|nr:cGMP-dependent protein kinase 2 isoform X2 [Syngnathus scovelli]